MTCFASSNRDSYLFLEPTIAGYVFFLTKVLFSSLRVRKGRSVLVARYLQREHCPERASLELLLLLVLLFDRVRLQFRRARALQRLDQSAQSLQHLRWTQRRQTSQHQVGQQTNVVVVLKPTIYYSLHIPIYIHLDFFIISCWKKTFQLSCFDNFVWNN